MRNLTQKQQDMLHSCHSANQLRCLSGEYWSTPEEGNWLPEQAIEHASKQAKRSYDTLKIMAFFLKAFPTTAINLNLDILKKDGKPSDFIQWGGAHAREKRRDRSPAPRGHETSKSNWKELQFLSKRITSWCTFFSKNMKHWYLVATFRWGAFLNCGGHNTKNYPLKVHFYSFKFAV